MAFPGFNRAKRGTISNGDWDRDGVKNKKDCNAMDWKKQDGGESLTAQDIANMKRKIKGDSYKWMEDDQVSQDNQKRMKGYAPGEHELIKDRLEYHRLKNKNGGSK